MPATVNRDINATVVHNRQVSDMSKESPNHISVASKAPAVPGAKGEKPEPKPVPIRTGKKEGLLIEKRYKRVIR